MCLPVILFIAGVVVGNVICIAGSTIDGEQEFPVHLTRVNKRLIELGCILAKHPFECLPISVVTVMTIIVTVARGWGGHGCYRQ